MSGPMHFSTTVPVTVHVPRLCVGLSNKNTVLCTDSDKKLYKLKVLLSVLCFTVWLSSINSNFVVKGDTTSSSTAVFFFRKFKFHSSYTCAFEFDQTKSTLINLLIMLVSMNLHFKVDFE